MSPARTPGLTAAIAACLSLEDRAIHPLHLGVWLAERHGPGQVDAVSAVDPAKVQHDEVTLLQHSVPGVGVRQGRVRSAGDDGFERAALETGRLDAPVDLRGELLLGDDPA